MGEDGVSIRCPVLYWQVWNRCWNKRNLYSFLQYMLNISSVSIQRPISRLFISYAFLVPGWMLFGFRIAVIFCGMDSTNWLKHRITPPHNCCRFTSCTSMMRVSCSITSEKCNFMFKNPLWDDLSFVAWHVILLEAVIKICICYSHKGHIPLIQGNVDSWIETHRISSIFKIFSKF